MVEMNMIQALNSALDIQLKNDDRIGISLGHISNANIGNKNPGVEIISLSYQKPF